MTRRQLIQYLTYGAAGLSAFWLSASNSWSAQFLRDRMRDTFRTPAKPPRVPDPLSWSSQGITASWLGHATVLIHVDGLWIITDPVLGNHVGLDLRIGTFGPKRFLAPALLPNQLPPIDLILLSHAHMDHMDLPTLRRIPGNPAIVTARSTQDIIYGMRSSPIHELGWGESKTLEFPVGSLKVTGLEVKHWGARWGKDTYRGYNAYLIERNGKRILFGGDTAYTDLFKEHRSYGSPVLACMPIGAYEPWIRMHCNPEQAVEMADQMGSEFILPIHHQAFRLSREPMQEPIERFANALNSNPKRMALTQVGETFRVA